MTSRTPDYDELWHSAYGDMQERGPVHRHMRRLLRGLLAEVDYRSAIEIGCGAGHNFELLEDGRPELRLAGIDVSQAALESARGRHPSVELHQLDIQQRPADGRWDLALCALVLEHLPDDEAALRNIRAMTSGHLVLATIGGELDRYRHWEEAVGHVRNYRPGELEAKLTRAGFTVERLVQWGFPLWSPLARLLQGQMTPRARFGLGARAAAAIAGAAFHLNSSRRGDLLLVHARAT
jgi:SAM-dependent methyltransferase